MCCITKQRETTRPDTADKFAKEDAKRDQHSELELPLQRCLITMRVRFVVMTMLVMAVIVQNVSVYIEADLI